MRAGSRFEATRRAESASRATSDMVNRTKRAATRGSGTRMTLEEERERFNSVDAPTLAGIAKGASPWKGGSSRFRYFRDDRRFIVIAGAQEGRDVDLALALGLSYREGRRLVLVLPEKHAFATLQRASWLAREHQPVVYLHNGSAAERIKLPSRDETVTRLKAVKPGLSPQQELRAAATPKHLGHVKSAAVHDLVEWATKHTSLDAGHRRGERSWHCMGQRVLYITSTAAGVRVTAGIHYSKSNDAPEPTIAMSGQALTQLQIAQVKQQVEAGIEARLHGSPPIHRPDEHWLQAVIRQDPSLVGVEQPALREVPAFRPHSGGDKAWGRGYIDLLGLDGHGDIRIVETKLSENVDDLLIFQGLDYYLWAQAYSDVLTTRLGAPRAAAFEIHYVIGDTADGKIHVSRHAAAQVRSLDPKIRWRFQTVHGWYGDPNAAAKPRSALLAPEKLP
jgi:hypothetical protein